MGKVIVVVGSLNMDVAVPVQRLPVAGETVLGSDATFAEGGKGGNQAAAAAALGAAVRMVGRVGRDAFGERLVMGLRELGVDVSMVETVSGTTGIAVIVVDERGQNQIAVAPGANLAIDVNAISSARSAIETAGVVVLQCEIPSAAIEETVRIAAIKGVPVLLNAAPADQCPRSVLPDVAYLVVNEVEAEQLTGMRVTGLESARIVVRLLRQMGPNRVVVTLGKAGAVADDGTGPIHVPAPLVQVVDATGAGDAFVGALARSIVADAPFFEAVHFGVLAGSLAVTRVGARASLPSLGDVRRLCRREVDCAQFQWLQPS